MKNKLKMTSKSIAFILIFSCLLTLFVGNALAEGEEGSEGTDFTVVCKDVSGEKAIAGMSLDIYKVGDRNPDGSYTFDELFEDCTVPTEESTAAEVAEISASLFNVITAEGVEAVKSAVSTSEGNAVFAGLDDGLYIVYGAEYEYDNYKYTMTPVFYEVASWREDGNSVDLSVIAKISEEAIPTDTPTPTPEEPKPENFSVTKTWEGDGKYTEARSASVKIEIYMDEKLYKTVDLDAKNNWKFSWEAEKGHKWSLKEVEVPKYYKVMYKTESNDMYVINTFDEVLFKKSNTSKDEKLPQTGQLWWPVPVLLFAGVILVGIGVMLNKKNKAD